MTHDFQVGFVGVGRMGANMARRLRDQGYTVTAVYDLDRERSRALANELGCEAARSPARIAESSTTIITVVTDDSAMKQIYADADQDSLLVHAKGRLFLNCATVSPHVHVELEALVEAYGGQSLEVCMASSITQARDGTLYLMCGGRREAFDRAKPLLDSMSKTTRYIGGAGRAAQVKALVNMVMNINTAALAEGLGIGGALGLDLTMLREVFAQTGAASRVLETDGEDMQNRAHDCYFSAAHAAKDCGIALGLAESVRIHPPLAHVTLEQYRRLVSLGKGKLDKSAIAELTFPGRS
jgi:3-hydroxyisobutyrate dehydrogenase-like beta-hydroxyacid dehydrogenase